MPESKVSPMECTNAHATRRLPLQFEKDGTPFYSSTQSPEAFKQTALCLHLPKTVIPIIFVPGIMGTNLRLKAGNKGGAWTPPNGKIAGLGEAFRRGVQKPIERQEQMNPKGTEVDLEGKCSLPSDFFMLTTEEAKKRGWGALHADSYHETLMQLEVSLNEQYAMPGQLEHPQFAVREEIGLLTELGASDEGEKPKKGGKPNYKRAAFLAGRAWGTIPPKLSAEEVGKLDDYYYPVWAHGYNWLESNETSALSLIKKINEVIDYYKNSKYFNCDGKVILVTHSMGGLVSRRAAQISSENILGIVHGVQPVAGAPVVYRRFRAGTEVGGIFDIEGAAVAAIVGWSAADITPALACSPGPLELLPTKNYPPRWLKVTQGKNDDVVMELPESDPYSEIYGKTTDDCWWGMIDPELIDPAGIYKGTDHDSNVTPMSAYLDALKTARKFHTTLDLFAHPETYGYYGMDGKKYLTFGSVSWNSQDKLPDGSALSLFLGQDVSRTTTGKSKVLVDDGKATFKLQNHRNQAGDGTVPLDSGVVLGKLNPSPKAVFKMTGFDHQNSYKNIFALQSTIYSIAKLIQLAAPAKL